MSTGASAQSLPADESAAIEAYHKALRMIRDGKTDAALDELRAAIHADVAFARAYGKIVEVFLNRRDPGAAAKYFGAMLDEAGMGVYANYALGVLNLRLQRFQPAELFLKRSIALDPNFAPAYTQFITLAIGRGGIADATAYLKGLLQTNQANAAAHYGLGFIYQQQDNWQMALEELDRADDLAPDSWEALYTRYLVYSRSARSSDALRVLSLMLSKAEQSGHLEWKAHVLGRTGIIYSDLGDYAEAIAAFEPAIAITQDLGDRGNEQAFEGQLGLVYFFQARYKDALRECTRAAEIAHETGDRASEGRNLGVIANIHSEMAEYPRAIHVYEQAIRLAQETGDQASRADQLASLALVYSIVGYHEKAETHLRTAIAEARELKNPWLEGKYHELLGEVYAGQQKFTQALQAYDRGLQIAQRIGDRLGEASRMSLDAEIRARMRDYSGAFRRYEEALAISRESGATLIEGRIRNDLGGLYTKTGRCDLAVEQYRRALSIGTATRMPAVVWRAQSGIAAAYQAKREFVHAREYYIQAVETIEQVRANLGLSEEKAGFLSNKLGVYKELISLLLLMHRKDPAGGYEAEAFRYLERSRARSSLDLLAEAENKITAGIDPSLLDQQRLIHARISRLQRQLMEHYSNHRDDSSGIALANGLTQADEEDRSVRREIHSQNPRYSAFRYPEAIELQQARQLLPQRSLLLEYSIGEKESYLFAITRDENLVARLPAAGALALRIKRLRAAIATGPRRTTLSNYWLDAQSLYRDLIEPAGRLLRGRDELIIASDGVLNYLPFAALLKPQDNVPNETAIAGWPFLIRDYAISYVPSASVLATLRRHTSTERAAKLLLAYADAASSVDPPGAGERVTRGLPRNLSLRNLPPLEFSGEEVKGIARLYPRGTVDILAGAKASERDLKSRPLEDYRIIHFAVHALLDETNPQYSGLALSLPARADAKEDGLLQVYEIFNLKLNADLVILSACETALGKQVNGEGLVGLTQAFFYAGARAIAATLWDVDDRSTADLMLNFHRQLRAGKFSKAECLRRAQLDLIENTSFAHPYYWAPFLIIGNISR